MKTYYKRRLPHLHPIGATFFVTWRLHGSLPGSVVQQLSQEHTDEVQDLLLKIYRSMIMKKSYTCCDSAIS